MANIEQDPVVPMGYKIKQVSVFNLDYLYKDITRWFQHFDYSWKELQYRQENQPDGTTHLEIRWTAEKEINNYMKFVIDMEFLIFMKDAEVEENGVKVKRNKGAVEIRTGAYIAKDLDIWKNMNALRRIYDNYLIRHRIEDLEDDLYIEAHKLYNMIKSFLNLHRYD